jgi:hypothetical protein
MEDLANAAQRVLASGSSWESCQYSPGRFRSGLRPSDSANLIANHMPIIAVFWDPWGTRCHRLVVHKHEVRMPFAGLDYFGWE